MISEQSLQVFTLGFDTERTAQDREPLKREWAMDDTMWPPEDACFGTQRAIRKLRFLHALCVCRQHQNRFVLFSEAAFPCPQPFNAAAHDNDINRASFVRWAIAALRGDPSGGRKGTGLLRHRPGGVVWMHRDIRLALLHVLERQTSLGRNSVIEASVAARYERLVERLHPRFDGPGNKAKLHLCISETYETAFRSSNSPRLVLEQLYHLHQAIFNCTFAWQGEVDRVLLLERCLLRAQRALHTAKLALRQGIDPDLAGELFRERPPIEIRAASAEAANLTAASRRVLRYFDDYLLDWQKLAVEFSTALPTSALAERQSSQGQSPEHESIDRDLAAVDVRRLATRRQRSQRRYSAVQQELLRLCEIAIGDREGGLLDALRALQSAAAGALAQTEEPVRGAMQEEQFPALRRRLFTALRDWLHQQPDPGLRASRVLALLQLLRELACLWCDELDVRQRLTWSQPSANHRLPAALNEDITRALLAERPHAQRLCVLCNAALALASFLAPDQDADEDLEVILLRTYYAEGLAHLGRFTEAHHQLNHAFSRLSRSKFGIQAQYWAILELRRGLIYLQHARSSYLRGGSLEPTPRHRERLALLVKFELERSAAPIEALGEGGGSGPDHHGRWRAVLALLDDAWLAFGRARRELLARTQATRHWERLYTFELSTLAMYSELESWLSACHRRGEASKGGSGGRAGLEPPDSPWPAALPWRVEGLPDRAPGGRLRKTLEIMEAALLLDGGTVMGDAAIIDCACLVIDAERCRHAERAASSATPAAAPRGRDDDESSDLASVINQLRAWSAREPAQIDDTEFGARFDTYAAGVRARAEALVSEDVRARAGASGSSGP